MANPRRCGTPAVASVSEATLACCAPLSNHGTLWAVARSAQGESYRGFHPWQVRQEAKPLASKTA
jgi:hypothetical protein